MNKVLKCSVQQLQFPACRCKPEQKLFVRHHEKILEEIHIGASY